MIVFFALLKATRLLAIDDDLRMKATEFIQNNFFSVIETREFHALLSIKVELVGKNNNHIENIRFI